MAEACPVIARSCHVYNLPPVAMQEPPPLEPTLEEDFADGGDDSAQLLLVGFFLQEWRAGNVSAADAKAAILERLTAEPEARFRPSRRIRRLSGWLLQARRFRKGMTRIINKAMWRTLMLALPIWHWGMQWRGRWEMWGQTRHQLLLMALEQIRKFYHEVQELGTGRLPDDPDQRILELERFQAKAFADMAEHVGTPRALPPMEERPGV